MSIRFDELHLLSRDHEQSQGLKKYQYTLAGWTFSSYDKEIFVYYKRAWKVINLKNLGNGMQIAYQQTSPLFNPQLNLTMVEKSLAMYEGFDEEKGEKYWFLPNFSKEISQIETFLKQGIGLGVQVEKHLGKYYLLHLRENFQLPESMEEVLSFLFTMLILYGKFDEKDGQVVNIKAHIPLFGRWNQMENWLGEKLISLQGKGLFISHSIIRNGDKAQFQFSSNDREILAIFIEWHTHYFPDQNLSLNLYTQKQTEIKDQLLDFLKKNYPEDFGNIEALIKNSTLKFLR